MKKLFSYIETSVWNSSKFHIAEIIFFFLFFYKKEKYN